MSEEEKKAIERVKRLLSFNLTNTFLDHEADDIVTILNLIEKQNNRLEQLEKENEEYKLDVQDYLKQAQENAEIYRKAQKKIKTFENNFISKDRIREKIEEYKKYGLKRNIGSFIDMSTYKAITYEEALDELKEELLG